jgi:hypothetical protein
VASLTFSGGISCMATTIREENTREACCRIRGCQITRMFIFNPSTIVSSTPTPSCLQPQHHRVFNLSTIVSSTPAPS